MDEVLGLLAEQVAKKLRAAQQNAAARAAAQGGRLPVPGAPAATPAPGSTPPQPPADALSLRRLRRDMPPQPQVPFAPLEGLLGAGAAPGAPGSPAAANPLLAAFGGGSPLLSAIVLAEALGPPLALQPFDARVR